MKFLSLLILVLAGSKALAFPEMVRHGYVHCTSCHTTLTGGNLLNDYGRQLSREVLSQKTILGSKPTDGDEYLMYGLAKGRPEWLTLGGDLRVLQMFVESKQASRGRFLIMQMDLDASAQISARWRAFVSLGRIKPNPAEPKGTDYVASVRHGIEYLVTDPESSQRVTVRAGRFMPAYGIGFAEHTFVTRRLLNFGPGLERYAAEVAWNNDYYSLIGTSIFAQADGNWIHTEKGGIVQAAMQVREKSKFGINYYQAQRDTATNTRYTFRSYGLFAHIAFNHEWYGLLEIDRPQFADQKWGFVDIFKLGYEFHQGWHLLAVQEHSNLDTSNPGNPKFEAYSIGTQWFPRPHWDLYALYRRERDTAAGNDFQDVVWLIGHFYL